MQDWSVTATLVQVTRQSMLGPHHPSLMKNHGVLVLLPDCQTRWMVVPSPTQEPIKCYHRKRKHFSGPTDIALNMPRTRSDNTLTQCKGQTRSRHKYADHCSLNSILNVAEMELIKMIKEESLPQDRLTSQGTDHYIAPFYTKKRPFSRHHSESCVTDSTIQCDNEAPTVELSNKTSNSIINSLSNDDAYKITRQHSLAKLDEMEICHPSGQEMQMVRKLVKLTPLVSRQKVCSSKSYFISNTEHMPSYSGKMLLLDRNDSENSKSVRVAKRLSTIDLSNVARSIESRSMKPNDLTGKSMKLLIKGKTIELTKLVKVGNIMELINPVQCKFT
uniref:Uncharacterized protein n=1 Tax=Timema bartmani TaxID=61472 RepID=A0A7R9I3B4_9NEOP|nr:unnamed protein product [Timema bartmani]